MPSQPLHPHGSWPLLLRLVALKGTKNMGTVTGGLGIFGGWEDVNQTYSESKWCWNMVIYHGRTCKHSPTIQIQISSWESKGIFSQCHPPTREMRPYLGNDHDDKPPFTRQLKIPEQIPLISETWILGLRGNPFELAPCKGNLASILTLLGHQDDWLKTLLSGKQRESPLLKLHFFHGFCSPPKIEHLQLKPWISGRGDSESGYKHGIFRFYATFWGCSSNCPLLSGALCIGAKIIFSPNTKCLKERAR